MEPRWLLSPPLVPPEEWEQFAVFAEATNILEAAGIPHVMGGGVAVRAYGRRRKLKDGDIFLPRTLARRAMDELTRRGGFHTRDTDATWLYKATKGEVLVDLIVRTTGDIPVTDQTTARGRAVTLYGHVYQMMSPEDVLHRKIHSHRDGRPDLLDALSMLANPALELDWDHFQSLVGPDPGPVLKFLRWARSAEAASMVAGAPGQPAVPRSILTALGRRRAA